MIHHCFAGSSRQRTLTYGTTMHTPRREGVVTAYGVTAYGRLYAWSTEVRVNPTSLRSVHGSFSSSGGAAWWSQASALHNDRFVPYDCTEIPTPEREGV